MRVEITIDGKKEIHEHHPLNDYTLCGLALEGADFGEGDTWEPAIFVESHKAKITCKNCIKIINYCRNISP